MITFSQTQAQSITLPEAALCVGGSTSFMIALAFLIYAIAHRHQTWNEESEE